MEKYRHTTTMSSGHEINGLSKVAYELGNEYQLEVQINKDVTKTGWFSKKYTYNVTFIGESQKVRTAVSELENSIESYNRRLYEDEVLDSGGWPFI